MQTPHGVDEDYDGTGQQPEQWVPMPLLPMQPSEPAAPARRRVANYAPQSPGGAASQFDPNDPSGWARNDPARLVLDALVDDAYQGAMHYHPQAPRVDRVISRLSSQRQRQPPTSAQRRIAEEQQWRRLNDREKRAIRRVLEQIPCHVTHDSELGMMRLVNRFRNSYRPNRQGGNARRTHVKKFHKRNNTHKRIKSYKRMQY